MAKRRDIRTTLACVMGAMLIVATSGRSVEAAPLTNTDIDLATLCLAFDCTAGATSTEEISISPEPDPDGSLLSIALPGLAPELLGTWLYAYQLTQGDESTAVISSLIVPFEGLFGGDFSFFCVDCGGSEPPVLADYVTGPDTIIFSLEGLLKGQTSVLFGAISSFGPKMSLVGVGTADGGAEVLAIVPDAAAVPEPASMMLLGSGIAALAAARRRKQQR